MSPETRRLLNPAFLAAINASAATGYIEEAHQGLPFVYSFLVPAMVLHKETREQLPKVVTTKMPSWAQQNAGLLAHLPTHIADLQRLVRDSLVFGYNIGILGFDDARGVVPSVGSTPAIPSDAGKQSAEVTDIFKRSHFLGRWLSTAGNPPTVFSILGIGIRHASR